MSQIGSSSGVRVAAQPLSNIYTVLLLVGTVALVLTLVLVCITMSQNYGVILGVSEEGKANKEMPETVKQRQQALRAELEETDKALERFPEGVTAAPDAGTSGGGAAPAPGGGASEPEAGGTAPAEGGAAPAAGETEPGSAEPADAPAGN